MGDGAGAVVQSPAEVEYKQAPATILLLHAVAPAVPALMSNHAILNAVRSTGGGAAVQHLVALVRVNVIALRPCAVVLHVLD